MTNPTLITTPFAENGDKNVIPESVGAEPQNATMQAGFPPITQQKISEGGIPPERNDFNGILNLYGQHIVHLNKGLPYEFDQAFANRIGGYPIGSELVLSDGLTKVVSTIANNTNDPNVNMMGWVKSGNIITVESFAEMLAIENPKNGMRVYVNNLGNFHFIDDDGWVKDKTTTNGGEVNVLDFIPYSLHAKLADYSNAKIQGDLKQYIDDCLSYAESKKFSVYFPSGFYPVSSTIEQPLTVNVRGDFARSFIIPTSDFTEFNWLWKIGKLTTSQQNLIGLNFQGENSNIDSKYIGGLWVSSGMWFAEIKSIRFINCFYGGLFIAPRHASTSVGVTDLVNLNIDNLFFLDCGSVSYHPAFEINLTDESSSVLAGNWTDGSVKNIDIATADGDRVNTRGPIGFKIKAPTNTIFNVAFDRFFIGTRLQTHVEIDAPNLNGNTFSNFSGETHNIIYNGQTMSDVTGFTYQLDFKDAGQWNLFSNINGNMSLGDLNSKQKGLRLDKSYANTFSNLPLNASYNNVQNELLNITQNAKFTTFNDSNIRLLENRAFNNAWGIADNLFTTTIIDNGLNTSFNGQQVRSNAIKERPLDYYSNLNSEGTAPIHASTGTGYSGLSFLQDSNSKALRVVLASSASTRQLNFYYNSKRLGKKVYFVVVKVKQTTGSIADNFIEFGMFDQSFKKKLSALNTTNEFTFVFNNTNIGVDGFVIALGNSVATTEAATFIIEDIYISSNCLPYKPNYTVVSEN
nr:MAG TPA: tailspike protein [Caudoviricetes sp.]